MKKPVNIYLSKSLRTMSDLFEIGALCDSENMDLGRVNKQFVWLEFKELKSKDYPDIELVWDNGKYLIDDFLPFLLRYKEKMLIEGDKEEFDDIYEYLDDSKVEDLIELIETAKSLNWL